MRSNPFPRRARALLGGLLVAAALFVDLSPAAAGNGSAARGEPLTAVGRGTWHPDLHGGVHAEHAVAIRWPDGTVEDVPGTVTLDADDGSLPDVVDACEAATTAIDYDRYRTLDLEMVATGQVCLRRTYDGKSTFHSFTGRYLMDEGPRKYLDTDGWVEMSFSANQSAYVLTTDT